LPGVPVIHNPREMFYPDFEKRTLGAAQSGEMIFPPAIRMNPPTPYPY
jgi:hypothetical protein